MTQVRSYKRYGAELESARLESEELFEALSGSTATANSLARVQVVKPTQYSTCGRSAVLSCLQSVRLCPVVQLLTADADNSCEQYTTVNPTANTTANDTLLYSCTIDWLGYRYLLAAVQPADSSGVFDTQELRAEEAALAKSRADAAILPERAQLQAVAEGRARKLRQRPARFSRAVATIEDQSFEGRTLPASSLRTALMGRPGSSGGGNHRGLG